MDFNGASVKVDIQRAGYEDGKDILHDISFTIDKGETILLVGPSGSGKTTLILAMTGVLNNLLNGYVNGKVDVFGVDPLDPDGFVSIPETIGVVLQDPDKQLAMSTPYDEVAFTLQNLGYDADSIDRMSREILSWMDLDDKMFMDSIELSGGEKKRLCIASSIVHKPRLLILDEPTANLDPWGVREILKYIKLLRKKGYTIIIIEHKARYFLNIVDEIYLIDGGRIISRYSSEKDKSGDIISSLTKHGVDASSQTPITLTAKSSEKLHIKIENLTFKYPSSQVNILNNVSLEVYRGDVAAFIGPNGSGKTTLLKIISGFYKPIKGKVLIYFDGGYKSVEKPGKDIIYVPQEPDYMFIYSSVKDELFKASEGLASELLNEAPWLRKLLDQSPYNLSYGQRKWLTYYIARLYDPEIYLFDEPSAGLDLNLLKEFMNKISMLREYNKTVLIATHDPRILSMGVNRVFLFKDGNVVEKSVKESLNEFEELFRGDDDED